MSCGNCSEFFIEKYCIAHYRPTFRHVKCFNFTVLNHPWQYINKWHTHTFSKVRWRLVKVWLMYRGGSLTTDPVTSSVQATDPANTGHSPNAVSMLDQRRRRWANGETALGECPVFAGEEAGSEVT